MTEPFNTSYLEGEPLDLLSEAVAHIEFRQKSDSGWTFQVELEPRLSEPFVRALMRIESRLMLDDADLFGTPGFQNRSYEERAADAMFELVMTVAAPG